MDLGEQPSSPLALAAPDGVGLLRGQDLALLVEPHGVGKRVERGEQRARELLLGSGPPRAVVVTPANLGERERLAHLAAAREQVLVPDDEPGPVAVLAAVEADGGVAG